MENHFALSMWFWANMNVGTQAVMDRIAHYIEAGLEYPIIFLEHETVGGLLQDIETFAREVMPAF